MYAQWQQLSGLQQMAMICARLVSDDLANFQPDGAISAERMADFSTALRDSLYESLWVITHAEDSEASQEFLAYAIETMPEDWAPPQFSQRFVEVVQEMDGVSPQP